jgi:hypothetical protein
MLLTFNKQGSIRITGVNEFPNATYFEKLATPAVKGKPSEELETTTTASSLLHATKVKETNSNHLKFFIIILFFFKIYKFYGLIVQEAKYCCPINPAPNTCPYSLPMKLLT